MEYKGGGPLKASAMPHEDMSYRENIETLCSILAAVPGLVYLAQYTGSITLPSGAPELTGGVGTILVAIFSLYFISFVAKRFNWSAVLRDASIQNLDKIEGCIETDGIAWSGTAYLQNGRVRDIELPFKPICPNCQTGLVERTKEATRAEQQQSPLYSPDAQPTPIFLCPNNHCDHTVERDTDKYDDAQRLFERHTKQITESTEEDYSLHNLATRIDGAVTPQTVWEEYADVVDNEQVSTNCFH